MKHILWVDDKPKELKAVAEVFNSDFGIEVDFASTLADAILRMRQTQYDAIIIDIFLPRLNYSVIDLHFGTDFIKKYSSFPGVSLIELLVNKEQYKLALNSPTNLTICSNSDFETLKTLFNVITNGNVKFWPKGKISSHNSFAKHIFNRIPRLQKKKKKQVSTKSVPLDNLVKTRLAKLEKYLHDFKDFYNGLYDVINTVYQKNESEIAELLSKSSIPEVKDAKDIFPILYLKLSDFSKHCMKINNLEGSSDTFLNDKLLTDSAKYFTGSNNRNNFSPIEIKEVCSKIRSNLKKLALDNKNRQKSKEIYALINISEKIAISEELHNASESIINNLQISSSITYEENLDADSFKCNIRSMIHAVMNEVRLTANSANVELRPLEESTSLRIAKIPPKALRNALINMFTNAIKYCDRPIKEKPWVTVRLKNSKNKKFFSIEIESWGPEITKKEIEERLIFNRKYRGEKLNLNHDGYGIGLNQADYIMQKFGGTIDATSVKQRSGKFVNTFFVRVPIM